METKSTELFIAGKSFNVPVEFSDSLSTNSLELVESAIRQFSANSKSIFEASKIYVEKYVCDFASKIGTTTVDNLLDYVTPQMMLARYDSDDGISIAILCGFIHDPEHGIAIVYRNQEFVEIGNQDIVVWW